MRVMYFLNAPRALLRPFGPIWPTPLRVPVCLRGGCSRAVSNGVVREMSFARAQNPELSGFFSKGLLSREEYISMISKSPYFLGPCIQFQVCAGWCLWR